MLIVLDDSLDPSSGDLSEESLAAFENLAACRWEGKHLLHAERPLLRQLAKLDALSSRGRGVYQQLYANASFASGMTDRFEKYILVTNSQEPTSISDEPTHFRVPLAYFADSIHFQSATLLGENQDDARWYMFLGKACLEKRRWHSIFRIHMSPQGGGGDTTVREFKACRQSGRMVLCIADSDKRFPKPQPGDTARKILREQERTKALSEVYVLEVRDAENSIPHRLFQMCITQLDDRVRAVGDFRNTFPTLWPWFDVKNGLKLLPDHACWQEHQDALETTRWNDGTLVPGLGDKTLLKVLAFLEEVSSPFAVFGEDFRDELASIGSKVLAWGVAPPPMRS